MTNLFGNYFYNSNTKQWTIIRQQSNTELNALGKEEGLKAKRHTECTCATTNKETIKRIEATDKKVMTMRTEIADLQQQIEELSEDKEKQGEQKKKKKAQTEQTSVGDRWGSNY